MLEKLEQVPLVLRIGKVVQVWADPFADPERSTLERYGHALDAWIAVDPVERVPVADMLGLRVRRRLAPLVFDASCDLVRVFLMLHELGPEDLPRLRAEADALVPQARRLTARSARRSAS